MSITVLNSAQQPVTISTIDDLMALVGLVSASPATNTLQDRLKAIATALATNHTDEVQLHTDIATTLVNALSGIATQTTLAAVLAKLSSDPATQTTLASALTALNSLVTVFGSATLDQGAGAVGTHTLRVALPTDQIGTPGQRPVAEATTVVPPNDWKVKHVAASATATVLGTGTAGDWLEGIMVIPETTASGAVSYKDGSGTVRTIFAGGTVGDVKPFYIPLGDAAATNWNVTTGANVHVIAYGKFA